MLAQVITKTEMQKLQNQRSLKLEKHKRCSVCHHGFCVDKIPKVSFKIVPNYPGPVTRSLTKILHYFQKFIIVELYRCMPLLGDEEKIPNWVPHIVHYTIVFTSKSNIIFKTE